MSTWKVEAAVRRFVDLHTHSTASDGTLPPADLIALADRRELAAIALTDHDTLDGLAPARQAAAAFPELKFVPGIEVSAQPPSGTLHILGLAFDEKAPSILDLADFLRSGRRERNPAIVAKLQQLGVAIDMEDVLEALVEAGGGSGVTEVTRPEEPGASHLVVSRTHIALAMLRKGYVATTAEAFDKYIGKGKPAYVDRPRKSAAETIAAIRDAGGISVLAHPVQLNCANSAQIERIVHDLKDSGLDAIEAYHSQSGPELTRAFMELARRFNLAITGGSDFHGAPKPDVSVGRPRVPLAAFNEQFLARLFARS
ncbi:MAG: PHP domain-containing protein [Planctomycetaceae bacterium]|nr:PHP domain-containing protein [Planctomycetaceae bacterium]